jgi:hypothetical protein
MIPGFIHKLFMELRRRGFELVPDDFEALRMALWAGFGWESREALSTLLTTLWAKSPQEQVVLTQLFAQVVTADELAVWQMTIKEAGQQVAATSISTITISTDAEEFEVVQTSPLPSA